jgi:hypothetical protein
MHAGSCANGTADGRAESAIGPHAGSRWITLCHFRCSAASARQAVPAGPLFAGAPCRSGVAYQRSLVLAHIS